MLSEVSFYMYIFKNVSWTKFYYRSYVGTNRCGNFHTRFDEPVSVVVHVCRLSFVVVSSISSKQYESSE